MIYRTLRSAYRVHATIGVALVVMVMALAALRIDAHQPDKGTRQIESRAKPTVTRIIPVKYRGAESRDEKLDSIGIKLMYWTLQKFFESSAKIPQHLTAADRHAAQLKLTAYRYDAGQAIWALVVPLQEFCEASATTQCVLSSSGFAELKSSEWMVFLSREVTPADLKQLITTFSQDKPPEATLRFIAIPAAWEQFQSDIKTLARHEYGRLTLNDGISHEFIIEILETPPSALAEPPIAEQLVPEGPDYLRGREEWFREKFEKHD